MIGSAARGIRNNNPLNIEHVPANKWLGLANPPSDGRFCRFVSMDYGIRAACVLLMRYYDVDGLDTVRGIISKWAPNNENNTGAYIAAVASRMRVSPNSKLDLHDYDTMHELVRAMAKHETGADVDGAPINKGLALAGFAAPSTITSVMMTPTMISTSIAAAPAVVVSLGAIIEGISDNAEVISGVVAAIGGPAAGGVAVGVMTALAWGWGLYNRLKVRENTGV